MVRAEITVTGIIQGVGFRPFIYRLAHRFGLSGMVINTEAGVFITASGPQKKVDRFVVAIRKDAPPLAVISSLNSVVTKIRSPEQSHGFEILPSRDGGTEIGPVAPDTAACPACLAELFDPENRRYRYPFINCTDCGPRYTIIKKIPFDRPSTAMADFPMCDACSAEYADPADRRFHAQAISCPACGPVIDLVDNHNSPVGAGNPLVECGRLLRAGKIVAIKGVGGFHLAVDATNSEAVGVLRARKNRAAKPLAIMVPDLATGKKIAEIDSIEQEWLCGPHKPVVLLSRRKDAILAPNVAPDNTLIGIMLPYTPLHHLILREAGVPALVMTSGNLAGSPIVKDNEEAMERLAGVADFFLFHNLDIVTRNDDSVIRVAGDGEITVLRRARAFVPVAVHLACDAGKTLALGAMVKNTVCITRGGEAFVSQHIGDLDNLETVRRQVKMARNFGKLLRIEPDLMVHDLHPDYPSSRYARMQKNIAVVPVQHHHAHAVSCMAEHGLPGPVIAITLDGTGYGPDKTVWGGEVLIAEHGFYDRVAHLRQVHLPGGEMAIREPWRMAVSHLYSAYGSDYAALSLPVIAHHQEMIPPLTRMMGRSFNSPLTSSCGRLFDAVAALLDLRYEVSYEGEAAAALEMLIPAKFKALAPYDFSMEQVRKFLVISPGPIITGVVDDIRKKRSPEEISIRFHMTIIEAFTKTTLLLREKTGLNQVVLSGGVFQNMVLLFGLKERLRAAGFLVYAHRLVPTNDGGLALGQAVAGRAIRRQARR